MNVIDLVRHLAEPLDVAILITDANLAGTGPTILFANSAFLRMSSYESCDVLGRTPRMMQGAGTSPEGRRQLHRALRADGRFLGRLQNYRSTGEAYLCEIDIRPIRRLDGGTEAFIAFEREVVRRPGRPTIRGERYKTVDAQAGIGLPFLDVPIFAEVPRPGIEGPARSATS